MTVNLLSYPTTDVIKQASVHILFLLCLNICNNTSYFFLEYILLEESNLS